MPEASTIHSSVNSATELADGIVLEGVRTNNLKNVTLKIGRGRLTVICGVSGSGKSSLAFDTLYAEGQRRYVETFSPYARQFLDQVERPDVDKIDGIPPAIALRQNVRGQSSHSTVGTRTDILEYLRILFARAGRVICGQCHIPAERMTADRASAHLVENWTGRRAMLVVPVQEATSVQHWQALGFVRFLHSGNVATLESVSESILPDTAEIVTDRISINEESASRVAESIEQAFQTANGGCRVLVAAKVEDDAAGEPAVTIDGQRWHVVPLSRGLCCLECGRRFQDVTADHLNFLSAVGACATCEGTGQTSGLSFSKVVPNDRLSLAQGAIAPWTTDAYRHELDELLSLAPDYGIAVDRPFRELSDADRRLIHDGVPDRYFGGLAGFHRWLVRNRYKQGVSVFLNRWRSWTDCAECGGRRLSTDGGVVRLGDLSLPDASQLETAELRSWLSKVLSALPPDKSVALSVPLRQLQQRLGFLIDCGLGYLSLDRKMKTLSGGEAQRVVLTAVLGSGMINTLYVLDEPTSGLHPEDAAKVIHAARSLQETGNTVVVVEHDPEFILAADEVVEIGPNAGNEGGDVVFQGTPEELDHADTATGKALQKSRQPAEYSTVPSAEPTEWLSFEGVACHNIRGLSGRIPLNCVCVVSGLSGSGKSSLVAGAVYPAVCRELGQVCSVESTGTVQRLSGVDALTEVRLLDQSPLPRSRRSIPATVIGAFDEIRRALASTHEAKKRNYTPGMFSFNSVRGGRCPKCEGYGVVTIEMQFLADIQTTCEACSGRRFRPDVLEVRFRDRSINDILKMTAEEGFRFFTGHRRIQQRLNSLRQAGLGYVRLGQPVATLSGGESQRLRIAALLAGVPLNDSVPTAERAGGNVNRTMFILDEPSTGLHLRDIGALMQCLRHLVEIGHSVVVIEHDEGVIRLCDYVIEMGPGPGRLGGKIVSAGIARSVT